MRAKHCTASLVSHVVRSTGLTQAQAQAAIDQALFFITSCVSSGEAVALHGFGVFTPYERKARVTRIVNPGTHQECLCHHPQARYVRFKPSPIFQQCVKNTVFTPTLSHVSKH